MIINKGGINSMEIRKAVFKDAPNIAKVHVDSWRTTYKDILAEDFLNNLSYDQRTKLWENNMEHQNVYVAENKQGKIVGFSVGGKRTTKNYEAFDGELFAIYIFKEEQGNGIGKLLMKPVVDELAEVGINNMMVLVLEDNPSRHFYEKLGARKVGALTIKIAGTVVNELVYGWDNLQESIC